MSFQEEVNRFLKDKYNNKQLAEQDGKLVCYPPDSGGYDCTGAVKIEFDGLNGTITFNDYAKIDKYQSDWVPRKIFKFEVKDEQ